MRLRYHRLIALGMVSVCLMRSRVCIIFLIFSWAQNKKLEGIKGELQLLREYIKRTLVFFLLIIL